MTIVFLCHESLSDSNVYVTVSVVRNEPTASMEYVCLLRSCWLLITCWHCVIYFAKISEYLCSESWMWTRNTWSDCVHFSRWMLWHSVVFVNHWFSQPCSKCWCKWFMLYDLSAVCVVYGLYLSIQLNSRQQQCPLKKKASILECWLENINGSRQLRRLLTG